ncbi:MAG: FkbM family methyltransferase [Actinobacteria bacterium]|nr:FkbM family methyltransferase [Actinomycetota bacterium]
MNRNYGRFVARLRAEPKRTRFILSRLLWVTHLGKLVRYRRNGVGYRLWPTSASAQYWKDQNLKSCEWPILKELDLSGKVVIDVGANVGIFSLQVAQITNDTSRVLAIEAHPKIARFLTKNISLNGHVSQSSKDSIEVDQITLDEVTTGYEEIYFLKIDVEGSEYQVLDGAANTLRKTRYLMVEYYPKAYDRSGISLSQVTEKLEMHSFEIINRKELEIFHQKVNLDEGKFMDIVAVHL